MRVCRTGMIAMLGAGMWVGASAQTAQPQGIDVLRAYEGTWDITMEHFDSAHSKASKEKSQLHNDCWKSGAYFACNQYVNGDSKILLVFTYDQASQAYTSYQIPQGGAEPGSGKLHIDRNTWTFPWEQKDGEKTTWFRVVNVFTGADSIEMRQEYSTDQAHWTVMAKASEKKVAPH